MIYDTFILVICIFIVLGVEMVMNSVSLIFPVFFVTTCADYRR